MPKVFRPKISNSVGKNIPKENNALLSPLSKSSTAEVKTRPPSPAEEKVALQSQPEPDTVSNAASVPSITRPSSMVDIDLIDPKTRSISQPVTDLFSTKIIRRSHTKVLNEPIPDLDKPLDRSSMSLRMLLRWNPVNKPAPSYRQDRTCAANVSSPPVKLESSTHSDNVKPIVAADRTESASHLDLLAPQLRLDADGNIILDESSLIVTVQNTSCDASVRHVNEDSGLLGVTYNSFRPSSDHRGGPWKPNETLRFYRALSTIGLDFYLMAKLFPNRSRLNLKQKFKRESRLNPYLINQALRNRRNYDLTALVPLSDDEQAEEKIDIKPETVRCTSNIQVKSDAADGCPKRARRKMKRTTYDSDKVNQTIDAVLAQFESEARLHEHGETHGELSAVQDIQSPPDNLITDFNSSLSSKPSCTLKRPLLQRMIDHKRTQSALFKVTMSSNFPSSSDSLNPPVSPDSDVLLDSRLVISEDPATDNVTSLDSRPQLDFEHPLAN